MADDLTVQYLFRRKSLVFNQSFNPHEGEEVTLTNIKRNIIESSLIYRDGLSNQCEENPCNEVENISIIVQNKKRNRYKKRRKYKVYQYNKKQLSFLIRSLDSDDASRPAKSHSVPELKPRDFKNIIYEKKVKSSVTLQKKTYHQLNTNFIVNTCCRTCDVPECLNPFINPLIQARIYRCQLNTKEESCCCACNSDTMFEVMKSLYDCYKKKNCDHCDCILCGHLPREERRLGELRKEGKDMKEVGVETTSEKEQMKQKMAQAKAQGLLTPLEGKTPAQKEKIMRGLAKLGLPLPEAKTTSEKKLIKNMRKELGLPPEPKTAVERERHKRATTAGVLTPLEGKTTAQKENILRKQAELGLELPEGRTASEKAFIKKIKAEAEAVKMPSERIRKAKAAGFLTPLEGKTAAQKEKILRGLAKSGMPLPEGKTPSEKKLIKKVKTEMGLPEPKTPSEKHRMTKALAAGIVTPLEGKTRAQKEKILRAMQEAGVSLPEGRTTSEKALIAKVKAEGPPEAIKIPSERMRKAKAAGLLTPLEGKTPAQKEKILRGLAKAGIPLPEGKTPSEINLIKKVRTEMGSPEPKTPSEKHRMTKALAAGIVTPLEGKTPAQKEKVLRAMQEASVPLPEGHTASEKALIAKVKAEGPPKAVKMPSERIRKAKAAGLLTPLEGKTPAQKEKILRGLAKSGMPLPEGKTPSEINLIKRVRTEMGLPEPKTPSEKHRMTKALAAGIVTPLEGKTPAQKEKILRAMQEAGVSLPEGRTASEKALITKVKEEGPPEAIKIPSERIRKAKAAGLLTPLEGKTPAQKEKILRGLAKSGMPLPEGKTPSEKKLIKKVRTEMGLPEPKTPSEKYRMTKALAAGIVTPLEGKTPAQKEKILRAMHEAGVPLPEARTASEKALIAKLKAEGPPKAVKMPSERIRKAKAAGLLTPLEGKTPAQKEKILRGLAKSGMPLPEGKTPSEKKLIQKVRNEMGLPEPKTPSEKHRMTKALAAGIVTPLEGKTPAQKERILRDMQSAGVPLPEGRTASEKALIAKVKAEGPPEEIKMPSERIRKAKAAGLLTPLGGKTAAQKEKILRGLAKSGMPLPKGKTPSEIKLINKVRTEMGLPEPKTPSEKHRMTKALAAGIVTPLEGKTPAQKEKIIRAMQKAGVPLPEGRTASEKALIARVKADLGPPALLPKEVRKLEEKTAKVMKEGKGPSDECICGLLTPKSERVSKFAPGRVPPEKLRAAKAAGLLTPLEGKTPAQKEKIIRGLAKLGLPLPESKTPSDKKLINKVRNELGLPPEPRTPSMKERYARATMTGLMTPLEGKTVAQKEKILRGQAAMGLPLPEGRTPSEKALIAKVKAEGIRMPSERIRKATAAGLLTPLEGKTPAQKENILRGLAKSGMPLPEGQTQSEKKLIKKVRTEMGLPEPKTPSEKHKMTKALAAGIVTPLEGKTRAQKEKILRAMQEAGVSLPEGRTASEKALITKVKEEGPPEAIKIPSERIRKAKAAGLLTPLEGKTPAQKEKILRGLAKAGIPLPEGKTTSEKKLIQKVRKEMGLPEPKTPSEKHRMTKALAAGIMTPLEGKTRAQKEKILRGMQEAGVPLPEGRTAEEKALIAKVKAEGRPEAAKMPSERIRKAKAAGFLTPLEGKTPAQKEKILRGLAKSGMPLPEGRTPSEAKLIKKVRTEMGLPEPKTLSEKHRMTKALAAGIVTPLEGKTPVQKEKVLKAMQEAGVPLPEGRTASEKALIAKVKAEGLPVAVKMPTERIRKATAAGLLTPLEGKTPAQKEKILRGLAKAGIPLPDGKTLSEKKLIQKVRKEMGLPEPKTLSEKQKMTKELAAGIVTSLEGKTPTQKEKILRAMQEAGVPLPEGRNAEEKALIAKVNAEGPPEAIKIPSERMRKAKAAGLLTPLEGKTPAQKEKILRGLAKAGIPLPDGKTSSEKKLIQKVRKEMGLPEPKTPSEKHKLTKALAAGIVTPLEGKTPAQKEKILRAMQEASVPLPEGRTASEKALIAKVKAKGPPEEIKIPSERIRKATAAGLLTPLEGKTAAQKEKILRGLATSRMPLPEGKTPSEKKLIQKVRREMGLPEPKTPSEKQRMTKALAAGIVTPLEGKTPAQKEKVLRAMQEAGISLPEGRTASEKALIAKVKAKGAPGVLPDKYKLLDEKTAKIVTEGKGPSDKCICPLLTPELGAPIPEKLRQAKAEGLLTPLEGKTPAQRERIIRGLTKAGLPIPEGITASEKSMVQKVQTEMGIPPEAKTASDREVIRKAKTDGLLTPLAGKTKSEKERIIKGLISSGLPIPEGTTASDKALIRKVRTAAGLPPEPTPSDNKSRIKMKSRGVGVAAGKGAAKAVGAKAGIAEELEEIAKSTKCDRACGCDKKKIRFKHSYVKIRVTSPDISSLCPCPNECVPGVKGGVFVDNEGIKVTVGTALILPSFTLRSRMSIQIKPLVSPFEQKHNYLSASCPSFYKPEKETVTQKKNYVYISPNQINSDRTEYYLQYSSNSYKTDSEESLSEFNTEIDEDYRPIPIIHSDFNSEHLDSNIIFQPKDDHYTNKSYYTTSYETFRTNVSVSLLSRCDVDSTMILSSRSATKSIDCESIVIVRTESSLSLTSKSHMTLGTISVISFEGSVMSSSSVFDSREFEHTYRNDMVEHAEYFIKEIDNSTADAILSNSEHRLIELISLEKKQESKTYISEDFNLNDEVIVYNVVQQRKMDKLFYHSKLTSKESNKRLALKAIDYKGNNKEVQYGKKLKKHNKSRKVVLITATYSKNNTSNENVVIIKVSDKTKKHSKKGKRYNKKTIDNCVDKSILSNDEKLRSDKHFCSTNSQPMKLRDSFMVLTVSENKEKSNDNSGQQNIDPIFENTSVFSLNSNSGTHVLKIVTDLLESKTVAASSSLFLLVRSGSADSNYSYEDPGSTIGIQLSEEFPDMSNIPEIYRMFDLDIKKMTTDKHYPIPRGLKISTKGKKIKFYSDNNIIDNIEKDYLEEHCRILKTDSDPKKVYHMVGTDTTADRPCCCQPANKCVSNDNILRPCSKTLVLMQHDLKGSSQDVYLSRSDRTTNVHPLLHEPSLLPLCPEQDTSKPKVPDCTNNAIQELKKRIEQYKIANEALQKKALECGQQQQQNTLSQCASPKCNKSHFQPSSSRNSTNRSQNIPKPDCTPDCSVDLQELKHKCDLYKQANYTLQKQAMENKRKACQQRHAAMQSPANNLDYCNTPPCSRSHYQPISSRSMGTCCMSPMNAMQNQTPSQMISQNNYFQDSRSIPCASPGKARSPACKPCCFGPVIGPLGPLPPSMGSLNKKQVQRTPSLSVQSRVHPPAPPSSLASRQQNTAQPDMSSELKARQKRKKERSKSLQRKDAKLKSQTTDEQLLSSQSKKTQLQQPQSDIAQHGTHERSKSLDTDQKKKKKGETTYNSVECQCSPSKNKGTKSKNKINKGGYSKEDVTFKVAKVAPPVVSEETFESESEYEKIVRQAEFEEDTQREIMKMKSDLTQTTSGFKVMKRPKPFGATLSELNMSFEELLDAFGDNADLPFEFQNLIAPPEEFGHESCTCEDKTSFLVESTCHNPKVDCQCSPPEDDLSEAAGGPSSPTSPNPLFDTDGIFANGLKFTIGGKGTTSKGLSGICCFDVIQQDATSDTKLLSDASLSSSEYLWYYK